MKKRISSLLLFLLIFQGTTKLFSSGETGWSATTVSTKSFIENKGQFKLANEKLTHGSSVKFAFDGGSTMIFFTPQGVSYSFLKRWKDKKDDSPEEKAKERAREEEEMRKGKSHVEIEAEEHRLEFKVDVVNMIWEGADPNAELIAEEQTVDYHTYTFKDKSGKITAINNIKAYKKLIYKNIYPNIDIEYVFHPEAGIKYALILHPGADFSKVKMKYSDDVKISSNGDIHIPTEFGDIVDHAPLTFYSGNKSQLVSSKFKHSGKTVSFDLGNYDQSKSLTIDPWTLTPTLSNGNCVWECETDGAGNVYIIGGDSPLKLQKYNPAGVLQWTYNTPYDTNNTDWLGSMATDLAGNSYVTNGSEARILKVNNAGTMLFSVTGGALDEYWTISFNCDQTKLIVGGTRIQGLPSPTGAGMIFDINTSTGAVLATKKVGWVRTTTVFGFPVTDLEEVRSMTSSYNSRYFFLTLDSIGCIDQNFSACPTAPSSIFSINSTYNFGYKCENYRPVVGTDQAGNSGIRAIRANGNFVYTQNGSTVHKRSLATGAIITTATIPGGLSSSFASTPPKYQVGNCGLDIDSCGNVYVGSGNAVIKYDSNLNLITSVATSFHVYDVNISYSGNIIACGATGIYSDAGRIGYVQQINMSSCNPMTLLCCNTNVCSAGPFCVTDAPVTLSPGQAGGTWSGPGVNATTGVFSPATAGAGTHIITYTLACGSGSVSITVSPCSALIVCQETNGTLSVSNGVGPYNWEEYVPAANTPITNSAECTACGYTWNGFVGQCLNGFTPVTTCNSPASWSNFATGTNSGTLPGTYPIHVIDANGAIVTIASAADYAALPPCASSCPPLTITPASQINVNCFGQSTGSFNASTTGGASPYDYTLMNGTTTVLSVTNIAGLQSFTGLPAGTYTLNVLDNNACPGTITVTITEPTTALAVSITGSTPASCGATNGDATALASGGTSPYDYVWTGASGTLQTTNNITTSNTLSSLAAGTYTVTITDNNNCTATTTVTITSTGGASVTITAQTNVLCFGGATGNATATATGGTSPYDYVWTGTSGTLQTTTNITGSDILNGLTAGTYTVNVTDNNGCLSSASFTITEPASAVAVAITGSTNTACGTANGDATALASGGTGPFDYVWTGTAGTLLTTNDITTSNTINALAAGTYTITITDANGCGTFTTVAINSIGGATVSATQTDVLCFGGTTGSSTATAVGGASPYDYVWTGTTGTLQTTNNITGSDILSGLGAGTYTVTVTDDNGCVSSTNVTITQPAAATLVSITGTTPASCGASDGSATAQATGGTGPYDYVWSNVSGTLLTTNNISGPNTLNAIPSGTYTVTITDNNNCTSSVTALVSNSGAATTSISSSVNVLCFGGSTGSATASTTGGSSPYDYVWTAASGVVHTDNNITTPSTASGLTAGTYTVSVTDNGGCVSTTTVTISQPATALTASSGAITHSTCGLANGSASVIATGGTPGYTYLWIPGSMATSSVSSLANGTYTVTTTDANSCSTSTTLVINSSVGITASASATSSVTCFGGSNGSATASGAGGTGSYTYSWSGGGGSAAIATGLAAGTYTVTVTNGSCTNTATTTITQAPSIIASIITTPANCGSAAGTGTATVSSTGGTGTLSYLWSTGGTTGTLNNLNSGSYSITVTDASGCTQTASAIVGTTGSLSVDAGISTTIPMGTSTTLIGSGSADATYNWSPPGTLACPTCASTLATPIVITTYTLSVFQNGCAGSDTVTVNIDYTCGELFVPTAFSPNGDGNENDVLKVYGKCITNLNFAIFDRWGEKVFETSDPAVGWDGTYKGKKLDTAVFVYYLTATWNGNEVKQHGNITLLK